MADHTAIEWTDATVNFWWGCTAVGPGCDHCYAEAWASRFGENLWGQGVARRKIASAAATLRKLTNPASHFQRLHGRRRRVFIQSMADLFDTEVPLDWFAEAWAQIEAANVLDLQLVTKRVSVVEKQLTRIGAGLWPAHAMLIVSVVNQAEAERDIPRLIALKARLGIPLAGLSIEPMLGPIVLRPEWLAALDWIICGGESGPGARAMHPDWARALRDQCAAAGVPFFFKQWGEWGPDEGPQGRDAHGVMRDKVMEGAGPCAVLVDGQWRLFTDGYAVPIELCAGNGELVYRLGKKTNGRLLDGVLHDHFPSAHPEFVEGPSHA